jgi:hypothetical protein
MYFAHEIGIKTEFVGICINRNGKISGHAIFRSEDIYYETQVCYDDSHYSDLSSYAKTLLEPGSICSITCTLSYEDAMRYALGHYTTKKVIY